jgi:hypothetical protein
MDLLLCIASFNTTIAYLDHEFLFPVLFVCLVREKQPWIMTDEGCLLDHPSLSLFASQRRFFWEHIA